MLLVIIEQLERHSARLPPTSHFSAVNSLVLK
jgi:hypothetical protein